MHIEPRLELGRMPIADQFGKRSVELLKLDGDGVFYLKPKVHQDARGHFSRTWCSDTFQAFGIKFQPRQGSTSFSRWAGTVRGMHFQRAPSEEAKVIRVSAGAIHDVFVDLREGSPDLGRALSVELSAQDGGLLFLPPGFAHGYQTLTDNVIVEYLMDAPYDPDLADGFRWDDRAIWLEWPMPVTKISEKDRSWPPLCERIPRLAERAL